MTVRLQALKLMGCEDLSSSLSDYLAPSLDAVLWRTLALDHVRGFEILQQ